MFVPLVQPTPVKEQPQHLQRWLRPVLLLLGQVDVVDEDSKPVACRRAQAAHAKYHAPVQGIVSCLTWCYYWEMRMAC